MNSVNWNSYIEECRRLYQAGEYAETLALYHQTLSFFIESNPEVPYVQLQMCLGPELNYLAAKAYLKLNNLEFARQVFYSLASVENSSFGVHYHLGLTYKRALEWTLALHKFKLCKEQADSERRRVKSLCQQVACSLALIDFESALRSAQEAFATLTCGESIGVLAWVYSECGQVTEAINILEMFKFDEDADEQVEMNIKYILAVCLIAQDKLGEALELMYRLLEADSKNHAFWSLCSVIYAKAQQTEDAQRCFNYALQLNNSNWVVWHNLGLFFENENKQTEAQTYYNKALDLFPGCPVALRRLNQLSSLEYLNPTIDIADFLLVKREMVPIQGPRVELTSREPVEGIEVDNESHFLDDKQLPMDKVIGLPMQLTSNSNISPEFMKDLVRYFQNITRKKLGNVTPMVNLGMMQFKND